MADLASLKIYHGFSSVTNIDLNLHLLSDLKNFS